MRVFSLIILACLFSVSGVLGQKIQKNPRPSPDASFAPKNGGEMDFQFQKGKPDMTPMSTVEDTLDAHFTICADTIHIISFNGSSQGYINGTTGNEFFFLPPEQPGDDTTFLYIREHGLLLDVPPPPMPYNTGRVKGVNIAFAPTTQRFGVADSFFVNIYDTEVDFNGNNNYVFRGRRGFRLTDFQTPYGGWKYVDFQDDTVLVDGLTMFSLQTRTAFSNDTLTFFLTSPTTVCGESLWFLNLANSQTHESLGWAQLSQMHLIPDSTLFGNPLFVPIIEYYSGPIIANAGQDQFMICGPGNSVTLAGSANQTNNVKYHWEPAGYLDDPNSPTPTATPLGTTTFTLTVTDISSGQTDTDVVMITVFSGIYINAGNDTTISCGSSVTLGDNIAIDNYKFLWEPSTGLSDASSPTPTATPSVTTTYKLTKTDPTSNCFEERFVKVTVTELLVKITGPNGQNEAIIDCGQSIQLKANVTANNPTFVWTPPQGLDNATIKNPMASPVVSTQYKLKVTDAAGCVGNASFDIQVTPIPVDAGAYQAGNPVTLNGTCGDPNATIVWSPSAGLSATNILNPVANPQNTTLYTLTVTKGDCTASDTVTVTGIVGLNGTLASALEVFPNPTDNIFTVRALGETAARPMSLKLVTLDGRVVLRRKLNDGAGSWQINVSDLSAGVYILNVEDETRSAYTKLIVR